MKPSLLNTVIEKLVEDEHILFAYLFGSFAQETQRSDSDIDVALYFDAIPSEMEQLDLSADLMEIFGRKVDLVILNQASPLLKFQVIKRGKILFDRSGDVHTHFCVRTLFELDDIRSLLRRSNKIMMEQIRQEVLHG